MEENFCLTGSSLPSTHSEIHSTDLFGGYKEIDDLLCALRILHTNWRNIKAALVNLTKKKKMQIPKHGSGQEVKLVSRGGREITELLSWGRWNLS